MFRRVFFLCSQGLLVSTFLQLIKTRDENNYAYLHQIASITEIMVLLLWNICCIVPPASPASPVSPLTFSHVFSP